VGFCDYYGNILTRFLSAKNAEKVCDEVAAMEPRCACFYISLAIELGSMVEYSY
jgi:hypothetical protein